MTDDRFVVLWSYPDGQFGYGSPIPRNNAMRWADKASRLNAGCKYYILNKQQLEEVLAEKFGKTKAAQKVVQCFGSID